MEISTKTGIVLLPPDYSKEQRDHWLMALKERLGGIKILVSQKLLSIPGPPGFTYVFATGIAWRVAWKPYTGQTQAERERWNRKLPLTLGDSIRTGAVDLRSELIKNYEREQKISERF
uniref:Uncharacterized protein n=1 Tax=viral metagenome TaxID=1070528 RepID=A0A6M3M2A0_9ZZZZ